uniref:RmlD-like substrate binding domain-containing protein n=1 Tax=Guillardia theta TaxID=55529 RepID=A0A7S4PIH6_GUITH
MCINEIRDQDSENPSSGEPDTQHIEQFGKLAAAGGAWILYVSCDQVFEGCKGREIPLSPADKVCPISAGAARKVACEAALVRATGGDCGVLRVPALYGPLEKIGESPITILTKAVFPRVKVGERVDGTNKRFPAFAKDVARACVFLSEIRVKAGREVRGVWHYGFVHPEDKGGWTDWDIVQMIARFLGVELGVDGACQLVKKEEVESSAIRLGGEDLSNLFKQHEVSIGDIKSLQEGLQEILTALIPSAALSSSRKDNAPLSENSSRPVEIHTTDGQKIKVNDKAATLVKQACNKLSTGKFHEAIQSMSQAIKLDSNLVCVEESSHQLTAMVSQLMMSGKHDLAEVLLEQMYNKLKEKAGENSWSLIVFIESYVMLYKSLGNWQKMLVWCEKGEALSKHVKGVESLEYATALSNLGLALGPLSRYEESRKCFERALAIREQLKGPDSPEVAQTLHNFALLLRNSGQVTEAGPVYERCSKIWREKEQWGLLAISLKDAAVMYRNNGEGGRAIEHLHLALAALSSLPSEAAAQIDQQLRISEMKKDLEQKLRK